MFYFLAEVDQQIAQFGKIKTLAEKASGFRAQREEMRKAKENQDVDMSDGESDEEIDWRQQNIF